MNLSKDYLLNYYYKYKLLKYMSKSDNDNNIEEINGGFLNNSSDSESSYYSDSESSYYSDSDSNLIGGKKKRKKVKKKKKKKKKGKDKLKKAKKEAKKKKEKAKKKKEEAKKKKEAAATAKKKKVSEKKKLAAKKKKEAAKKKKEAAKKKKEAAKRKKLAQKKNKKDNNLEVDEELEAIKEEQEAIKEEVEADVEDIEINEDADTDDEEEILAEEEADAAEEEADAEEEEALALEEEADAAEEEVEAKLSEYLSSFCDDLEEKIKDNENETFYDNEGFWIKFKNFLGFEKEEVNNLEKVDDFTRIEEKYDDIILKSDIKMLKYLLNDIVDDFLNDKIIYRGNDTKYKRDFLYEFEKNSDDDAAKEAFIYKSISDMIYREYARFKKNSNKGIPRYIEKKIEEELKKDIKDYGEQCDINTSNEEEEGKRLCENYEKIMIKIMIVIQYYHLVMCVEMFKETNIFLFNLSKNEETEEEADVDKSNKNDESTDKGIEAA